VPFQGIEYERPVMGDERREVPIGVGSDLDLKLPSALQHGGCYRTVAPVGVRRRASSPLDCFIEENPECPSSGLPDPYLARVLLQPGDVARLGGASQAMAEGLSDGARLPHLQAGSQLPDQPRALSSGT
jgi:hypothetical protein